MLLPPLLVLFLCITVNRKLLQQVKGHQKKVKWQTTSVNINTLLLEASVSNYFWWYLVNKTELSPVSQRLPAPHSHRADAAKCLLLVSVMTLAPVWITWPGGWLAGEPPRGFRDNTRQPEDNHRGRTHTLIQSHTQLIFLALALLLQILSWLCRRWPGSALAAWRQEDGIARAAAAVAVPTLVHRK